MIRGSPRTPDILPELSDLHVLLSEVCGTMIDTCGPYNLGGSAIHVLHQHWKKWNGMRKAKV
jgi:hypothetical protein